MNEAYQQRAYRVRFDWGVDGAAAITDHADVAVVVDVLSFTTTLSVALDMGSTVLPYPWNDETASGFARQHNAALAVDRRRAGPGDVTLSPQSVRSGTAPSRLVLPSPNGSTIAHQLGSRVSVCLGSCLRNAAAVARWISTRHPTESTAVAVIAAGERWPGGGLRPAAEDLWGAGAVIDGLATAGWPALSPEAQLARAGYLAVRGRELAALLSCASGLELLEGGWRTDVEIAAEADMSVVVPRLRAGRFEPAGLTWRPGDG